MAVMLRALTDTRESDAADAGHVELGLHREARRGLSWRQGTLGVLPGNALEDAVVGLHVHVWSPRGRCSRRQAARSVRLSGCLCSRSG
jgi:hypothetical protein